MLDNDWNKAFDEQWNIMYAVPPSTSSKELKTSFKNICRDLKCHSVWVSFTVHFHLCSWDFFFKGLVLEDDATLDFSAVCWPTCQRAGHLFLQVACSVPCVSSVYPQITVGWTLSGTTDDRLDGFSQPFCPGLCDTSHIYKNNQRTWQKHIAL